jgi:diketogulonate reductase-like aldo/keto reductase
MAVPSLKMNDGREIPQIGLGLWLNNDDQACRDSVKWALEVGYRHFDSAQAYENEQFLGEAIKQSGIKREEVFITTKIRTSNMGLELTESFDESLKKLQMDYVDLLLLHFPVTVERRPAWYRMEEIFNAGKAETIGVSNYTVTHLEELLRESKIKPAVNQVELHVYLQQPELLEYCRKNNIVVEAYSPLAHGRRLEDPVLAKIAKKHGKSIAQIMIRWCIEAGTVPLPKSAHKERIKQNLEVLDFSLDKQDMSELTKLDEDFRTCWDPTHVT